jgi:O-antigen/teichoic acid export membrane protein
MPASDDGRSNSGDTTGLGQVRHLARQSAMLLSSGVVGYAGALALNILLARKLGPAGFGAWVVAFGLGQTLATLGLMGADWILFRQGSYYHGVGDMARLRSTIHLALALCGCALGILGLILFFLAPTLGRSVFHDTGIVPLLRLAALVGPMIGLGQIMLFGTQAFKTVRDLAFVRNILQPLVRLGCVGIAIVISSTPFSAFVAILVAEVVLGGVATWRLHRRIPLLGPTAPIERGELIRFALPIWGSKAVETARGQLFPVLLGSLAALSASAVFVASRRIVVAPAAIIAALNQVYSPQASALFLQGRRAELQVLMKSLAKWSFALAFPLFCLTVAFPKEILSAFGAGFKSASTPLIVLSVAMAFQFSSGPVTTTLVIIGKSRLAFVDYVLVLAIEIGLGFALIPRYGVLGAAIGRAVGTALNNLVPMLQVWRIARLHPYRLDFWKPAVAGVVAAISARLAVTTLGLGVGVGTAVVAGGIIGVLYFALMLVFRLSTDDRAAIDTLLRRLRARPPGGSRPSEETGVPDELEETLPVDRATD